MRRISHSEPTRLALRGAESLGKITVGLSAQQVLARSPTMPLRVLAVVSNAAYLLGAAGDLVWFSQPHVPMHPRAISGKFDLATLCIGSHVSLDLRRARLWSPRPIHRERIVPPATVLARAALLDTDVLFEPLKAHTARMQHACRARDLPHVLDISRALIGLGPGLTPSGDDLLGGLLFTVYHLHSLYPNIVEWNARAISDLITWACRQTNVISHTILSDHAQGHGSQPLHELLVALLEGKPRGTLACAARRVYAIGHSSGAEMLAGMLTGILLLN